MSGFGGLAGEPVRSAALERAGNSVMVAGMAAANGPRPSMEDAHNIILDSEVAPGCGFFAVFDGHSGCGTSKYLAEQVHHRLLSRWDELSDNVITEELLEIDKEVLGLPHSYGGSTGVMATVRPTTGEDADGTHEVWLANVGDSRAIMRKNGKLEALSEDHKPDLAEEQERIRNAGGFVKFGRVDGILAVSRAFGDATFKENSGLTASEQKVCAVPDVTTRHVGPGDYVFLACDGLWDVLTQEDVDEYISDYLASHSCVDPASICGGLVERALQLRSEDNVTAVLLLFPTPINPATPYHYITTPAKEYRPGPFNPRWGTVFVNAYTNELKKHNFTIEEAMAWRKIRHPEDFNVVNTVHELVVMLHDDCPTSGHFGLREVNNYLSTRSYVLGHSGSQADVSLWRLLPMTTPWPGLFPHLDRWARHISSFSAKTRQSWPGTVQYPPLGHVAVTAAGYMITDSDLESSGDEESDSESEARSQEAAMESLSVDLGDMLNDQPVDLGEFV